jgi:hypothetical protein
MVRKITRGKKMASAGLSGWKWRKARKDGEVGIPAWILENPAFSSFWRGTEERMAEREGFEPSIELLTL